MSGRNQHHIPQCLLRGFAIPSKGKTKRVYVFKKGQAPYVSSTIDAAAERCFYSELSTDGSSTLDDQITRYENELGRSLVLLRELPPDSTVDATIAAELIAHLTMRGAHLRDLLALGAKEVITGVASIFTNEDQMRAMFGVDADVPTRMLREEIERMLSEKANVWAQAGLPEAVVRQMAFTWVKENYDEFCAKQSPQLMSVLNDMAGNANSVARDAHTKALTRTLRPESRVVALSQFSWTIRLVPGGGLILPDCVAVAVQSDSGVPEPYMVGSVDKINVVLCPICANRLLVGHRADAAVPDVRDFNEAAATCSHTFFVSAIQTPELERLAGRIGERSKTTVSDAVTSAVNEFISQASVIDRQPQSLFPFREEPVFSHTAIATENHHIEANDARALSYPVTFRDCADEETARKIASAVDVVVSEMSHSMPLGRLDSIVFAQDYVAALRDLERGFSTSRPLIPTAEDWGVGIAMSPLVIRNGVAKVSIVMQAWLGYGLIGEDHSVQISAVHTLAYQLAHVACVDLICKTVPDILLRCVEDGWEASLYVHMHAAWTAYFASRTSARFDPAFGGGYRDMLLASIEKARETIPRDRLAYRAHGDLMKFLEPAISLIGRIMIHAGMLLGHCDGMCQSIYDDSGSLTQVLDKIGLRAWMDALRRDLGRLFERRDAWRSALEFLTLNRHIERVLWQFGVFPWRNDQGEVRVEIPLGTDIAQLLERKGGEAPCDGNDKSQPRNRS